MNSDDLKLSPPSSPKPKQQKNTTKKAQRKIRPASEGLSNSEETKTLIIKLTPARHSEIKSHAADKGMSIKAMLLDLFDKDRGGL